MIPQPFDHCSEGSLAMHLTADRGAAHVRWITKRYGLEVPLNYEHPRSVLLEKNCQWPERWVLWLDKGASK